MAAKKPSAKATKAKQPVVKKAVRESATARKAAPARKSSVSRAKPAAAPRPTPVSAKAEKPKTRLAAQAETQTRPETAAETAIETTSEIAQTEDQTRIHAPERPSEASRPAAAARAATADESAGETPDESVATDDEAEGDEALAAPQTQPISASAVISESESESMSQYQDSDAGDGEDEGQDSGLNLLAGPRNVKPYIPRRGEQYMSKEQLEHFRTILNNWKRDLMQEVDRTMLHMKDEAANFPDPNDRATQESEFSLELRTRDRERKLIRKIDEAIKRIEDGTYGYCVETGEEIGIKRLEARPVATLCVEAQERRERREKQYGDRDDRYR
jgi:DnaK suppressor protein